MNKLKDIKHKMLKVAVDKVKMYDASHKEGDHHPMPTSPDYPTLYLDLKEAPFLKGYEVGDLCTIVIKTKVVSHNSSSSENHEDENYRLEVCEIGQMDHTPIDKKVEVTEKAEHY